MTRDVKRRPRVLVVASTFPARAGDGTPEFIGDLAVELSSEADVCVVTPQVPDAPRSEVYRGVKVLRFRYYPRRWEDLAEGAILENVRSKPSRLLQVLPFLVGEWFAVRRALKSFNPDIVHAHWIVPQGLIVRLATKRPMLLTTLGGDLYAFDRSPTTKLMSWIVQGASAVTVMNKDMRDRVINLGAPASEVYVIPMGANLRGMLARTEAATSTKRLLFVGRLVPKKGVSHLLEALRELPESCQWHLTIVGDGPLRSELELQAKGLPVEFVGSQTRDVLRQTYASSDLLVTPSVPAASGDQDGLPVAMLEAMGSGLPVVASQLPGIDEVIVDGYNGLLVPPADTSALARGIERLVQSSPERERLGRNAKLTAEEHSTETVGQSYAHLIREILSR